MKTIQYEISANSYLKRMAVYFNEMFPIPMRFVNAAVLYISLTLFIEKIINAKMLFIDLFSFTGILSLLCITIILRLMDELKDRDIDADLFPDRPVSSGRVYNRDIVLTLLGVIGLYLLINFIWPSNRTWSLIGLIYCFFMYKYFFLPYDHRNNLLLNLVTHNPIIPILLMYIIMTQINEYYIVIPNNYYGRIFLLILMFWLLLLSWELARKIRYPEDETAYVTYSKIFGFQNAIFILYVIQLIAFLIALYFYLILELSNIYLMTLIITLLYITYSYIKFYHRKYSSSIQLKITAEIFASINMVIIIVECLLNRG